ncbi:MAG TPA: CDGSH iron-sulfur domain-containing protein [Candidatus Xenobia bacterium]|jgi:CDGSH-type Zn-finger protein
MAEEAHIQVTKTGPYLISGTFKLLDHEGNPIAVVKEKIALCRCGQSSNKPFCDGTHKNIGFCQETVVEPQ